MDINEQKKKEKIARYNRHYGRWSKNSSIAELKGLVFSFLGLLPFTALLPAYYLPTGNGFIVWLFFSILSSTISFFCWKIYTKESRKDSYHIRGFWLRGDEFMVYSTFFLAIVIIAPLFMNGNDKFMNDMSIVLGLSIK